MKKNSLHNQIVEFLSYKYDLENASSKTKLAYLHDLLGKFLPFLEKRSIFDASAITQKDIEDFLLEVKNHSKNGSTANMNRKLACIKSFFNFLLKRNKVKNNPASEIKSPKNHSTAISYLSEDEQVRLITTVKETATPFYRDRDLAILKLFLGTGIRVSELINLKVKEIEFRTKGTGYIRVKRKGGDENLVPVNLKVLFAIKTYLGKRQELKPEQYVFLSKNLQQMRQNTVYYLVKHYLHAAGIEKKKWGPHILRHTVGVTLRRRGVDIATIQHLLGHRKLETTSVYLNVESQDLEKAVQLL
ncbi:MAG: tyrosine recombinase XerD subunit, integrase/recombinase XerD [Candidatus Gottesmanbacteria bacterium GW2011_GWA2_43_14]|uniref:Tyrosine recombinase XerD subunit, integrase/recombinase XerD n=1 Tax=Candidatus Gottesmanbacteria bacterium GW2011_GWA2_43_14 TaxID=1618443 RepID=A0A0G1FMY1_9BACT|nr:MAG: tyrosine recombinase XerD subunit, integrase/recombinase XerD [Candidatus Gottesmanbacteria bacterium GW2011_GWA2_43_14]